MTTFFIPGITSDKRRVESAYGRLREGIEPFVISRQRWRGTRDGVSEAVDCNEYGVLEFDGPSSQQPRAGERGGDPDDQARGPALIARALPVTPVPMNGLRRSDLR